LYRDDYARAGLPMLPVLDPEGRITGRQAVANAMALLVVSLTPTAGGMAGRVYFAGALALGVAFTGLAAWAAVVRTPTASRRLFLGSVLYLAALCTLLLADRV
jgi:heme O synthase-like polyprenyltransferase